MLIIFILNAKDKLSLFSIETKKIAIDIEENSVIFTLSIPYSG
jgi:hypothetical protein